MPIFSTKSEVDVIKNSLKDYATKQDFGGIIQNLTEFVKIADFNVL